MATIRQISEATGISVASVSRILSGNNKYSNSDDTRRRVLEAAERLGYVPNAAARLLKQKNKMLIGLAVRLSVQPYINRLLIAVHDEVVSRGYQPILFEPPMKADAPGETRFPSFNMLAGVLGLDTAMEREIPDFYRDLRSKLPVVAVYPTLTPDVDTVSIPGDHSMELVVEHLAQLGHREIACVMPSDLSFPGDRLKVEGWRRGMQKYGIPYRSEYELPIRMRDFKNLGVYTADWLQQLSTKPTALVCSSDEVALAVMSQLIKRGWNLPRDLSVVGWDGIYFGDLCYPSLTTVVQPVEKMAAVALDTLLSLVEQQTLGGALEHQHKRVEASLLVRDSTTVPRPAHIVLPQA